MNTAAAEKPNDVEAPSQAQLLNVIHRGLNLSATTVVSFTEITEFSNINYVYRVEVAGKTLYLKIVPERPKRFSTRLPRERVYSEAEGLRRFRALAGGEVIIPEVLFVDDQEMALAMSDVGQGRRVLFTLLPEQFRLLGEQAEALGRALGKVHSGTRGLGTPRPPEEEAIVRAVIFNGLLAPGAREVFPEIWDEVSTEMQARQECLIHADLWSKNLLVKAGEPVALVDFEGICYADPAFDLATLIAVALLPAIARPALIPEALDFVSRLLHYWTSTCGSTDWPGDVQRRTFRATATFLAARGFGPFAYELSQPARQAITELSRSLVGDPPTNLKAFQVRVEQFAGSA